MSPGITSHFQPTNNCQLESGSQPLSVLLILNILLKVSLIVKFGATGNIFMLLLIFESMVSKCVADF